jgi:GTP-binding protein HflX
VQLPGGHLVLFTDTVGFIQKLPTQLVAAFRATLEEIAEADLLVHVVDITHPNALLQWQSVQQTLAEIGADHIPSVTALNKIDALPDPTIAQQTLLNFQNSVGISARNGAGIQDLVKLIEKHLFETYIPVTVQLPFQQGQLISLFHEMGQITQVEHNRHGEWIEGSIPGRLLAQFQPYLTTKKPGEEGE